VFTSYGIIRYLEDIILSIPYRPPTDRRRKEESVEDKQVSRDYALNGLDDQAIQALRALSRSNRIDFQVSVYCDPPS
jgi:hypothetical protein